MTEFLAVLPPGPAGTAARGRCGRVLQEASPRLLICEGAPPGTALAAGVRVIAGRPDLDAVGATLSEAERLFAEAWLLRQAEAGKDRPTDGTDWDEPPFEAP